MATLTELTDEQLIKLYIAGENNALAAIITRHKNKIFTSIYLLVKDKHHAEDIFQNLFIRVIDTIKAGRYKEEGKFIQWVMCIAHNMSIDHFRLLKRMPTIKPNDEKDVFDDLHFAVDGVDKKMALDETSDKVKKLLDLLPEEQREVIILRHYANLSFKEISELTNSSINTSLGRMRYGLLNMRKIIKENEMAF